MIGPAQRHKNDWPRKLKIIGAPPSHVTVFANLFAYHLIGPSPATKSFDVSQPGPDITQFGSVRPRLPITYGQMQPQPGPRPPMARALPNIF